MEQGFHLNDLKDKRAKTIAGAWLISDEYHELIGRHARWLKNKGWGHFTYYGAQWPFTTLWRPNDHGDACIVVDSDDDGWLHIG